MMQSSILKTCNNGLQEPCVFEFAKKFDCHFANYSTRLKPGAEEPFYQAPVGSEPAIIFSNRDFFSSALHEIAHWCIAGQERRKQDDYGYWYEPDGRSNARQDAFFQVEAKPQALEWAFHVAAGIPFRLSLDNLNQTIQTSEIKNFQKNVFSQLIQLREQGFSLRAKMVIELLLATVSQQSFDRFIQRLEVLDNPKELLL